MKIKSLIYTALASTLLFASCDLNKQPVFDDETQAFIAFDKSSVELSEAAGNVEATLQCVSVAGINAEVTLTADVTEYADSLQAKEGTHFNLVEVVRYNIDDNRESETFNMPINCDTIKFVAGEAFVIKFDQNHRFASLHYAIVDNDEEDGDKMFDLLLSDVKNCNLGANKRLKIAVKDDENPIAALVGTYSATAKSAFANQPDENWTVVITLDETDPEKIWIKPLIEFADFGSRIAAVYGIVDIDLGIISIPYDQQLYEQEGYDFRLGNLQAATSGVLVANFEASKTSVVITFTEGYGVGNVYNGASEWFYNAIQAPTFTKQL